MKTVTHPLARLGALALLVLAALPAAADNINPASTNLPPWNVRPTPKDLVCETCNEKTLVTNGCVLFSVNFGRSPLVAGAPVGRMEVFEPTAARLPSGADVLRFDHPLMRRIVDQDERAGLVAVEEGSGWIVAYRDGVPVGWSSGADLAIRRDPATGLWIEQLEDRTLVCYNADNTVDHLVTPAGVRLDWDNAGLDVVWDGNAIGQVRSVADGLMDVTKLSPSSFRVAWYPPAAVGDKVDGRYAVSGNPAKTFTFAYSKVGAEHRYALREYRNEQFNFDYLWTTENGIDWTLVRDPGGLAVTDAETSTFAPGSTAVAGVRHATHVYSDATGAAIRRTTDVRYGLNGATFVGQSAGDAPAHWSAARAETGAAAGRLVSITNEYGGVTSKTYDGYGRLLSESTAVFGSLEQVASYAYETNLVDGFVDRRPRHVVVTRDGVVVSDIAYDYGFAPDGGRLDTVTRTDPVSGTSLVSSRLYYPVSSTNAADAGRIHLSVAEDHTATLYSYASTANGGFIRTATHGYIAESDASAPSADASRFAIAPSQSTRTVETVNFRGDVVRADEFVHTGEGWSAAGWTTYTYNLAHKRTGFADHKGDWEASDWICTGPVWQNLADGTAVTNTFDKAKRLSTSTHYTPFGAVTTAYRYNTVGQIVGTTVSTNGVAVRGTLAAYDVRGRRILSVDEQGRTNTVAYSADNRIVTRTTQVGAVTTTTLNTDGSVSTISGNVRPYETRSYGVDSATGLSWTEVRTAQDETSPSVLASRTFRNALGQTVRIERPAPNNLLRATLSAHNALGQLVSEQTEYRTQTPPLTSHLSPLTTSYAYDALGSLVRTAQTSTSGVWRAQSASSIFTLDPDGSIWSRSFSILSCSDPALAALTNRIDRKLAPLSQAERSHIVSYDLRGNPTRETESFDRASARGESRTSVPWAVEPSRSIALAGRIVEVVDFASVTNRFDYDALGQQTAATDGRGNTTASSYDATGQLSSVTDAAGNSTTFIYDAAGRNIATIDALGHAIHVAYDTANRKIAEWGAVYPAVYAYDSYGRTIALATTRDTNFVLSAESVPDLSNPPDALDVTRWNYDEATGLLLNKRYADGKGPSYAYSPEGLLARRTWARGVTTDYAYDDFDSLVSKTYSDETPSVSLRYDARGQLLSAICDGVSTNVYSYDQFGQITNELQNGTALARSYDAFGRPTGYCIGDGLAEGSTVSYTYDAIGRFASVLSGTNVFSYSYLPGSSLVSGMSASTGHAWERIYEPHRDLIATVHNRYGDRTISRFDYTNDEIGRRIARVDSGEAFSETAFERYSYNDRSEVIASQRFYDSGITNLPSTVPDTFFDYSYDAIGNRVFTRYEMNGQSLFSSYHSNNLNQYLHITNGVCHTRFEYDEDGNLTSDGYYRYFWNAENQMIRVEKIWIPSNTLASTISYSYDELGRTISKAIGATNTIVGSFLCDGFNVICEIANGDSTYNVWGLNLDDTLHGAGGVGGILVSNSKGECTYYLCDGMGNVTDCLTQTNTIVHLSYSPYGISEHPEYHRRSPFGFSSKYFEEEIQLVNYGLRRYSASLGRWVSRDPIEENGGMNLYSFVDNQPLNRFDSIGLRIHMKPKTKVLKDDLCCDEVMDFWMAAGYRSPASCIFACESSNKIPIEWLSSLVLTIGGVATKNHLTGAIVAITGVAITSFNAGVNLSCKLICEKDVCTATSNPEKYTVQERSWWPWGQFECKDYYRCNGIKRDHRDGVFGEPSSAW